MSTSLQTCEERDTKGLYKKVSFIQRGAVQIELLKSLRKFEQYRRVPLPVVRGPLTGSYSTTQGAPSSAGTGCVW